MTLLPCTDCCLFLGVDPKTLRHWLQSANLSWTLHPRDARLKCLTPPQLQHLADLHGRFSPDPLPLATSTASPAEPPSARLSAADSDLRNLLTHLQTQVATLQEQVTQLALALLREREWHAQELLSHPAAPLPPPAPPPGPPRSCPHTCSR